MDFISKLWVEYPVPKQLSIWTSMPGVPAVESLDELIDTVTEELKSDVLINESINATGMITYMPKDTVTCTSAMLSSIYPFQGNRLVKVTYQKGSNMAYLRYYPAIIYYKRFLRRSDLDELSGDRLRYSKVYALWKMSDKELSVLKTANMSVDNGQIDLSILEKFRDTQYEIFNKLKEDILLYATVN